jgi:hypothetical protein
VLLQDKIELWLENIKRIDLSAIASIKSCKKNGEEYKVTGEVLMCVNDKTRLVGITATFRT